MITRQISSPEFYQDASDCDAVNSPYSLSADPGWHIQIGSSSLITKSSEGDQKSELVQDDGEVIVYNVTTIHHHFGMPGKLRFSITATEYKNADAP